MFMHNPCLRINGSITTFCKFSIRALQTCSLFQLGYNLKSNFRILSPKSNLAKSLLLPSKSMCSHVAPLKFINPHTNLKTTQTNTISNVMHYKWPIYNNMHLRSVSNSSENLSNARHLISKLTEEERKEILLDLQFQESEEIKQKAEDKLASYRWRSRFGRPSSVPLPTSVDPTGTYCELPDEWLQKKIAEKKPTPPTSPELQQIALFNALPFIGFGFLDNVIMIVAGDYIDTSLGFYFGISTMAAAALGNTISDLAGIGSAWYVEMVATRLGVQHPVLTQEQLDMSSSRWCANLGRSFGVVLGCILGMFPLLFLPEHHKDRKKKDSTKENKDSK